MKKTIICFLLCFAMAIPVMATGKPTVSAKSAMVMECSTGAILYEKNSDAQLPMASVTKMMTAICAIEQADTCMTVTVSPRAAGKEGSSMYLQPGEKLPLADLLTGLMLVSGNDAATAIAEAVSGSVPAFVEDMNAMASRLSLTNTHFDNPSGLPGETHYSSARDLATLAAYSLENPRFAELVSLRSATVAATNAHAARYLKNHNKMLRFYEGAIGVKTGFTKEAGRCLVSAAERNGVRLIAVTLAAPDDWRDHTNLLDYGFERVNRLTSDILQSQCSRTIPVVGGMNSSVSVNIEGEMPVIIDGHYSLSLELPRFVYAPIQQGDILGMVRVESGGQSRSYPLKAGENIAEKRVKKGFFANLFELFH